MALQLPINPKLHHYHYSGKIIVDFGSTTEVKVEILIFTAHAHCFKLNVTYKLSEFRTVWHFLKLFPDTNFNTEIPDVWQP